MRFSTVAFALATASAIKLNTHFQASIFDAEDSFEANKTNASNATKSLMEL